jgi:predicted GNAT superfamily acetyltransferase
MSSATHAVLSIRSLQASLLARETVTAPRSAVAPAETFDAEGHVSPIVIRPLSSSADHRACVALQREIWGATFDPVPAVILQVAMHLGGVALGAFDTDGELVGFVFGLTGLDEAGKATHWSHMLAVRAHLRDAGVGRRLKESQRRELSRRHIAEMYWTYDPLVAKNAHVNLNVLGATIVRYVPDMYGDTGSPLHHGLATDRLVVRCETSQPAHPAALLLDAADAHTPILTPRPQSGDPLASMRDETPPRLRLEIPGDFHAVLAETPAEARIWHATTREHFQWALAHGYVVAGFRRDPGTARTFYLMVLP